MSRVATAPALREPESHDQPMRSWSVPRIIATVVLGSWASLFWFLILAGRSALFVSTRVQWVVPFGAILLTAATLGRLAMIRVTGAYQPLRSRDAWAAVLMIFPVVTVLVLPATSLGSFAVTKRASLVQTGISASASDIASGSITLIDVAAAQTSKEGSQALAARGGETATFVGFVTAIPGNPPGEFMLTRYYITCCIADAQTIEVHVVDAPTGKFQQDDWVKVTGKLFPLGRTVLLDATAVSGMPRPSHPYLTA
jgi:uncharacterized repeat protein (TIGR03943 family)